MADMLTTLPVRCPHCGARVQCRVKDDTGGLVIKQGQSEAVVVLTINYEPLAEHVSDNHTEEKS